VGTGFFYRLFDRPAPLDFTCDWNHLVDFLAGAASQTQVALYLNIARLVESLNLKAKPIIGERRV
jgi:hypothetical protein